MYHPYMSASDLSLVVDHHTKLAAKGHILHERIRANIAPVLLAKALNAKPVNRWNPGNAQMSLLKRTSGNIFFDYVSVAAAVLPASSLARDDMSVRHCFFSAVRPSVAVPCLPCLQNNVESVLLFCAVLVAIAGIMFNSGELSSDPNSADGQVGERTRASRLFSLTSHLMFGG